MTTPRRLPPRTILVAASETDARTYRDANPGKHIVAWVTPRRRERLQGVAADSVAYTPAGSSAGTSDQLERLDRDIRRIIAITRKDTRS